MVQQGITDLLDFLILPLIIISKYKILVQIQQEFSLDK